MKTKQEYFIKTVKRLMKYDVTSIFYTSERRATIATQIKRILEVTDICF